MRSEANISMEKTLAELHKSHLDKIRSIRTTSNDNNRMESEGMAMMRRIQAKITSMKRASEERGSQGCNSVNLANYPDLCCFFESMLGDEISIQDNSLTCSECI